MKLLNIKVQYTPVTGKKVLRAHGYMHNMAFSSVFVRKILSWMWPESHSFTFTFSSHSQTILSRKIFSQPPEWHYPEKISLTLGKTLYKHRQALEKFFLYNVRCLRKRKSRRWQKSPYLPHRKFSQPTPARDVEGDEEWEFFLFRGYVCENYFTLHILFSILFSFANLNNSMNIFCSMNRKLIFASVKRKS